MSTYGYSQIPPPPSGSYWIRLTRQTSPTPSGQQAYRLVVVATAQGVDAAIFVYLQTTKDPNTNVPIGEFDHIATPSDLEEVPVGAPLPDAPALFFRLDSVDFVIRSITELESIWNEIVREVRLLGDALKQLRSLQTTDVVTVEF